MDYEENIQILIYEWKLLILERALYDYSFTRCCLRGTQAKGAWEPSDLLFLTSA